MKIQMRKKQRPTLGENLFDKYCYENKLSGNFYEALNGKKPDRLVKTQFGYVICEIKDYDIGNIEKRDLEQHSFGKPVGGRWNPLPKTKNKIWNAIKQISSCNEKYSTIIILYNTQSTPYTHHDFILDVLYGKSKIYQLVNSEGAISKSSIKRIDFKGINGNAEPYGLFSRGQIRQLSAVGVLEEIKINRSILTKELDNFSVNQDKNNSDMNKRKSYSELRDPVLEELNYIEKLEEGKYGKGFFEQTECRLRVYHNHNALLPLSHKVFANKYDINYQPQFKHKIFYF